MSSNEFEDLLSIQKGKPKDISEPSVSSRSHEVRPTIRKKVRGVRALLLTFHDIKIISDSSSTLSSYKGARNFSKCLPCYVRPVTMLGKGM